MKEIISLCETLPLEEELQLTYDELLALVKDVAQDMPGVNWLFNAYRWHTNVEARRFGNRFKAFLVELKKGTVTLEETEKHVKKYEADSTLRAKENEYILRALDDYEEDIKATILARFVIAYYRGTIHQDMFFEMLEINRRMFISDYSIVNSLGEKSIMIGECVVPTVRHNLNRLVGLGLVEETKLNTFSDGGPIPHFSLSDTGKIFVNTMKLEGWYATLT